jgi:hypothetical protein
MPKSSRLILGEQMRVWSSKGRTSVVSWSRMFKKSVFPYPEVAMAISYCLLPFLFIFGFDFSGIYKNLFSTGESLFYYFPLKMFSKGIPLWNDMICTGNPAVADPQFQSFYPIGLVLMNLIPPPLSYNFFILIHYTLAGFFTYLFLKELGLGRFSSYWGSIVFMFCGFFIGHRRHLPMIQAGIWLPLVLFSLERVQKTSKGRYFLLGTFGVAMSILAGYPQVTMLLGLVTIAYAFWKVFSASSQERKWGMTLTAILILMFGSLLSAIQLFPSIDALRMATRESITYGFFTMYSFGYQYLPMLIFPYLFGGGYSGSELWFRSPKVEVMELTGYIGIFPLMMTVLAFATYRKMSKQVWFWTLVAAASFVLVLGNSTPLYTWLYRVPIFNLFRGPGRNWFEFDFALAVLSSFGMECFLKNKPGIFENVRKWTIFLAGGCLLIIGLSIFAFRMIRELPVSHYFFRLTKVDAPYLLANVELSSPAVYVPMILLGLSICFLIIVPRLRKTIALRLALILFLWLDLFLFSYYHERFFISYSDLAIKEKTNPILFLKDQAGQNNFRVFCTSEMQYRTLLSPNTSMLYGIHTINGFEDVLLLDYSSLTGFNYLGAAKPEQERKLLIRNTVLSIMSAKFIGTQDKEMASLLRTISRSGHLLYTPVFKGKLARVESDDIRKQIPVHVYLKRSKKGEGVVEIFRNENFLPRARFATIVAPVRDLEKAIYFIWKSQSFDFRNGVVAETGESSTRHLASGIVLDTMYSPRRIELTVKTDGMSFLVLSDQFYSGWKATVDGTETTIYRTNAIMRGIYIGTPGVHKVEFRFFPESLRYGIYVSSGTLLFLITLFVLVRRGRRAPGRRYALFFLTGANELKKEKPFGITE